MERVAPIQRQSLKKMSSDTEANERASKKRHVSGETEVSRIKPMPKPQIFDEIVSASTGMNRCVCSGIL